MIVEIFTPVRFIIAWICFCLLGATAAADPVDVELILSNPAHVKFVDTSLEKLLTDVADRYHVPLYVDQRALTFEGIHIEGILVSYNANEVPLRTALETILEPHQLELMIRHDILFITTEGAATDDYYDTRVYKMTRPVPVERRMRTIQWTFEPHSWVIAGGKGDAAPLPPNLLLLYQTPMRHHRIAKAFAKSVAPVRGRPAIRENGIEAKLDSSCVIDFDSVPITDALNRLAKINDVKISIEEEAIADAGIHLDDLKIKLHVGEVRGLASGLSLLLEVANPQLEWVVDESGITIATKQYAEEHMVSRTYDVKDILPDGGAKLLVEAIQYTVAASTWENAGGYGTIKVINDGGAFEILQSDPVHRILRQLFADIYHAHRKTQSERTND